jgi:hypothetical protein
MFQNIFNAIINLAGRHLMYIVVIRAISLYEMFEDIFGFGIRFVAFVILGIDVGPWWKHKYSIIFIVGAGFFEMVRISYPQVIHIGGYIRHAAVVKQYFVRI